MAGSALKVDKNQLEKAISVAQAKEEAKIFEISSEPVDFGRADSLRYNILTWVLEERYDKAIQEMKDFVEKPSDYPNFRDKVERFASHAVDLIYAIKAKRNFPGIASLTRAKQQELREKFKEHFKELQLVMKKIEKIQVDLRIEDARSTIYVIQALWLSGFAIAVLAFILEVFNGLAITGSVVVNDLLGRGVDWLFNLIGF
ncbi:MAG: hypothetical protein ACK5Y2_00470 [Bdellovibrionales bacterium]